MPVETKIIVTVTPSLAPRESDGVITPEPTPAGATEVTATPSLVPAKTQEPEIVEPTAKPKTDRKPKKVSISSVKRIGARTARISWKRLGKIDGYEIVYAKKLYGAYSKTKMITKNK